MPIDYNHDESIKDRYLLWDLPKLIKKYRQVQEEIDQCHERTRIQGIENRNWRLERKLEVLCPQKFRLEEAIENKGGTL